ncbi:TPA: TraR/DksA family transcriptional regulator [Citrobacter freundii]|nr:TraR/DksA family transcriptional regulator [Citrobacter freundii]
MTDSMDLVQQRVEEERQRQIQTARSRNAGASSLECECCGIVIPEQRRAAVPGCDLCVTCQEIAELKGMHYTRGAL